MQASEPEVVRFVVWINGFPGTGKLTIARFLVTLLNESYEGKATLVDNHSLIDPVEAKYPRDHPDYQMERRRMREVAFQQTVENPALHTRIIIFTDFQSNNDLGRDVSREYEAAARRAGRPFLPIYLECEIDENIRRVASSQRKSSGTTKLLNHEVLADIRLRCQLFRFEQVEGITLDVTHLSPKEAAERLTGYIVKPRVYIPTL